VIRSVFVLALVTMVAFAARSFLPRSVTLTGSGAALAFGFLLIAAVEVGRVFHKLKLPHLTGFILCGALFGPELLGLITPAMVSDLGLVKKVAVGLIALLAGCELNVRALKPRLASIGWISALYLPITVVALFLLFMGMLPFLPFAAGMTLAQRAAVALVCANVLAALSPAVVIGILSETRSSGPLSSLAMSIVVLADLLIVLTFSGSGAIARSLFPDPAAGSALASLGMHILGSIAVGIGVGALLALYIRRIGMRIGLFVFATLFVVAEAGSAFHIDPLLTGLSAGLFLENVSPVSGHEVIKHTEPASMPTFAVFFSVVGAEVHLHAFLSVAPFAIAAALVRAGGVYGGARIGARVAGLDRDLQRSIPFGMLPQAGIAIGLANLVKQTWAGWGEGAATLLLGTVVINELIGPVLFRMALARAGEIGRNIEPAQSARPAHASLSGVESSLSEKLGVPPPPAV